MSGNGQHLRGTLIAGALATALALAPAAAARGPPGGAAGRTDDPGLRQEPGGPHRLPAPRLQGQGEGPQAVVRLPRRIGHRRHRRLQALPGLAAQRHLEDQAQVPHVQRQARQGYAVSLQDMPCSKGTLTRKEMLIHSEMNRDGTQGRTEARRWNGVSDYKSYGAA
ncbi:hypothetical protein O1L60_00980 [Streptomyces diastatochromogenes]|nr:hypothetical protein [Streptomyces diastatochromogenes]